MSWKRSPDGSYNYIFRCYILACFCASQRVLRRNAELTLARIRVKLPNGWAEWHQIWHTCKFIWKWVYTPNKLPLETQGGTWGGGLGGQQLKSLGKLSDWHQLWFTSADSSGNEHRLNASRPSINQGAFRGGGGGRVSQIQKSWEAVKRLDRLAPTLAHIWEWIYAKQIAPRDTRGTWGGGGFRGQTFKSIGKLSNGWAHWHQFWFTSADSSGKGHRLTPSRPSINTSGGISGGEGSHIRRSGEAVTRLHRLAHMWYMSADSSGNGHRLNTIRHTIPQGHFRVF